MADLSPDIVEVLHAGAADGLGYCCRPGQVEKLFPALKEAEKLGYLRFLDIERPWITDAGRAAIGAPSQAEADRAKLIEIDSRRRKLVPTRDQDPRTDFDYRSYRTMKYVCVLAVKQPDTREGALTLRVGRTLKGDPQFLGPRNSIILPESQGRFVLTLMPEWIVRKSGLPTYPMPLDETDPAWTADERAAWDRLRQVCFSVNSRIRNAGRTRQKRTMHYGETA